MPRFFSLISAFATILLAPSHNVAYSSPPLNGNVVSPIKQLEPSLIASCAQTTVIAVQAQVSLGTDDENTITPCTVILSRSPPSLSSLSNLTMISLRENKGEVENSLIPLSRGPAFGNSDIIHILDDGVVLAVTGFAADARHLVRCSARDLSHQEQVYGKGANSFLKKVVVDGISKRMRGAAFMEGGRPYGVQALIVGKGDRVGTSLSSTMRMYTIDPSGGWRYWGGGGTAMGRNSDAVRKTLRSLLYEKKDTTKLMLPKSVEDAVSIAIKALVESEDEAEKSLLCSDELKIGSIDVVVVYGCEARQCESFHPKKVLEIYDQYIHTLGDKTI